MCFFRSCCNLALFYLAAEEAGTVPAPGAAGDNNRNVKVSGSKVEGEAAKTESALSWEEEKKRKNERKRLEKEEERLMNEIANAEEEKAGFEQQLALPAVYSDGAKSRAVQQKIEEADKKIAELSAQWETVSAQLEDF